MGKRQAKRKPVEPEVEPELSRKRKRRHDYEDMPRHESHGIISLTRVQGRTHLYGSPIEAHGFLQIDLSEARRWSGSGTDHYSDSELIARVWISETQFAQWLTTPNMGCGTPCTLKYYRDGDTLKKCEDPPVEESIASITRRHFKEDINDAMATMKSVRRRIEEKLGEARISNTLREELRGEIFSLLRLFEDSAPYVMERFDENCQEAAATAKTEVASYVARVAQNLGLQELRENGAQLVPLIEASAAEDAEEEG